LLPFLKASGSGIQHDGMQIFIKCLTGMSMTLSIEANDTIDNVKTKIQEQEARWLIGMEDGDEIAKASSVMMKAGKLNLTYAGKLLENAKKVSDYNIQKGSELHMVFNTDGGAKRGNGGGEVSNTSRLDKEEAIAAKKQTIDLKLVQIRAGGGEQDPALLPVLQLLAQTLHNIANTPNATSQAMAALSTSVLEDLLEVAVNNKNGGDKVQKLTKKVFLGQLAVVTTKLMVVEATRDMIMLVGDVMFDTQFMTSSGTRDFEGYMKTMLKLIGDKKSAEGEQRARAEHMV